MRKCFAFVINLAGCVRISFLLPLQEYKLNMVRWLTAPEHWGGGSQSVLAVVLA